MKHARETLVRAVKLARHPNVRAAEVRARFGVAEAALRKAKKELATEARWTDEDLILAALHGNDGGLKPRAIVEFVDWVEHTRWSEAETSARLSALSARGLVERRGERWHLAVPWP